MDQTPPIPPPPETSLFEMDIDQFGQNHLNTISKWGKFLAITFLIILIVGILMLATQYNLIIDGAAKMMKMDNQAGSLVIIAIVVGMALVFSVLFFLLRGCTLIKQGLLSQNSDRIADGFKALKVVFTISVVASILAILSSLYSIIAI